MKKKLEPEVPAPVTEEEIAEATEIEANEQTEEVNLEEDIIEIDTDEHFGREVGQKVQVQPDDKKDLEEDDDLLFGLC